MSSQQVLNSIKDAITKGLPKNMQITDIEFEGPEIAIYTKDTRLLIDEKNIVKNLISCGFFSS